MTSGRRLALFVGVLGVSLLSVSWDSSTGPFMRGSLTCEIVNSDEVPLANVDVRLVGANYEKLLQTDMAGSFTISALPIGRYIIEIVSAGFPDLANNSAIVHLGRRTRTKLVAGSRFLSADPLAGRIVGPTNIVDENGRIIRQETLVDDKVYCTEYQYDPKGRVAASFDNLNASWNYGYTAGGKIRAVTRNNRESILFEYGNNGQLWRVDLPWGYKITYLRNENKYTKRISKYKQLILLEFDYSVNADGNKVVVGEGTTRKVQLAYKYNKEGRLAEISNISTGETKSASSLSLSTEQDGNTLARFGDYSHEYGLNGNLVSLSDNGKKVALYREFNERNLIARETYVFKSKPVLGIEYLYDSQDRLVMKTFDHGIRYYYFRDKDGRIVHRIQRDLMTGKEIDGVCFEPSLSDFDSDGFELVRYGNYQERLYVKDAEGNKRFLVEIGGVFGYKTHLLQRGIISDGEGWGSLESVLSAVQEEQKYTQSLKNSSYLTKFFDTPLANIGELDGPGGEIGTNSMGNCGCYNNGYCAPEYSCCIDCEGGGGGGGGGEGGGGGGGGSYDCFSDVNGPMQMQVSNQGTFSLMTSCLGPYDINWTGGMGMNTHSTSFSTYWTESGRKTVAVTFSTSQFIESPPGSNNFEVVVIGRSATTQVDVREPPITVEIDTPPSTVMNISSAPSMPAVTFHATTNRTDLTNIEFNWYLAVTYNQDGRYDSFLVPNSGVATVQGYNVWSPTWAGLFAGGNVTVHVTAGDLFDDTTASAQATGFAIKGTNPSKAQILGIANFLEARAVIWTESSFRQYVATPYGGIGYPLQHNNEDWGLSQINNYNMQFIPSNYRMLWNWAENLSWGVSYLNSLHQTALGYLIEMCRLDLQNGIEWSWNPQTEHPELVWDDAFARYNTGNTMYKLNGNQGARNCVLNAAGCTYADQVRARMNAPLW